MELDKAITERRSIRSYTSKEVPQKLIDEALDLASWAPSAGNLQSRDFVVIRNQQTKDDLVIAALGQEFIAQAPVVIVAIANLERVAEYGDRGKELFAIQDSATAVQNLMLALHERGLGTVWIGSFDEKKVRRVLGLPAHARPVAILPIGYPAENPEARTHLRPEEFVHLEEW